MVRRQGQQQALLIAIGLSVVAGPDGATLAQAGREEALVFATLDDERLTAARNAAQHVRDLTALHNPPT